jgi:hypothetical protein
MLRTSNVFAAVPRALLHQEIIRVIFIAAIGESAERSERLIESLIEPRRLESSCDAISANNHAAFKSVAYRLTPGLKPWQRSG